MIVQQMFQTITRDDATVASEPVSTSRILKKAQRIMALRLGVAAFVATAGLLVLLRAVSP